MRHNNCEINILVKGRPITEYFHEGQTYVEGRADSQFEIEFKNLNSFRVEAVLSVDGKSIIDGNDAGINSSGYLLNAGETVRIPGWKLNEEQVAAFVFAGKKESYSTQMSGGSSKNNGVIGVMVFKEKYIQPTYTYQRSFFGNVGGGFEALNPNAFLGMVGGSLDVCASSAQPYSMCATASCATTDGLIGGLNNMSYSAKAAIPEPQVQNLGTSFGTATDFATQTVSFARGDMLAMIVLYYDNKKGLQQRGIEIVRPSRQKFATKPQAFPGMNCAPPPGWKG